MDLPLSTNFSILLLCIMSATSMMHLIFAGESDTLFKYIACVVMAGVSISMFGIVSEETVHIIVGLIK